MNKLITTLTVSLIVALAALAYVGNDRAKKIDELGVVSGALVRLTRQEADRTIPPVGLPPELVEPDPDPMCQEILIKGAESFLLSVRLGKENADLKRQIAKGKRHLDVHHADRDNLTARLRREQKETAHLRDLNDALRGYTGGP